MVVLCEDDYYREFIPAVFPTGRATFGRKAYCEHCKHEFRVATLKEQIEDLKKHTCNGFKSKKIRDTE